MIFTFYQIVAFFFIYAFLGWCTEVAYQGVTNGKLVNRGFLNGPVCPIYGVGMVGVLIVLTPLQENLFILFVGGIIITTLIELFGGWALDKMFHMRWWDYSDKPFNLHGYICLEFCLIWGISVAAVVRLIHPMIEGCVDKFPHTAGVVILIIAAVAMISDIIVTYKTVIGITRSLGEVEKIAEALRDISDSLTEKVGTTAIVATEKAESSKEKMSEAVAESKEKVVDAVAESREKVVDAMAESKEKITSVAKTGKDIVAETIETSKNKVSDTIEASKSKVSDSIEASREKIAAAKAESERKKAENAAKRAELEVKRAEMEQTYAKAMDKLQRQSRRMVKAFPEMRVSSNKKSFTEYLKNLRK